MSILIRGMEMPKKQVLAVINPDGLVEILNSENILIEEFQAIPVQPHGRLGDMDKLESGLRLCAKYQNGDRQQGMLGCCETIRLAPTIIPAEEGEI